MTQQERLRNFLFSNELASEILASNDVENCHDFLFTTWAHNKPKDYLAYYLLLIELLRVRVDPLCKLSVVINDSLPAIIEKRDKKTQAEITSLYIKYFLNLGFSDFKIASLHNYNLSTTTFLRWSQFVPLERLLNRYLPKSKKQETIYRDNFTMDVLVRESFHLLSELNIYNNSTQKGIMAGIGAWGTVLAYKEFQPKLDLPPKLFILLPKTANFADSVSKLVSLGDSSYSQRCKEILTRVEEMRSMGILK